jgi:hypothetical protein
MSFAALSDDLRNLFQIYSTRPIRLRPPAPLRDPLQLTEEDIRNWPLTPASAKEQPLVTDQLIREWCDTTGLPRGELYDRIAIWLACGFHRSELGFRFCDAIVHEIHGIIIRANEDRSTVYWEVFLAFDAGESTHSSKTPVETYTRPQIAELIERYSHKYPDV